MEANSPPTPVMAQTQFLIVPLDQPAQLGQVDQAPDRGVGGQGGDPEPGPPALAMGPFDEQPLLGPGRTTLVITMSRVDPQRRETGASFLYHALAVALMRLIVNDKRREFIGMAARNRVASLDLASVPADWEEVLQLPAPSPIGSHKISPA